MPKAKLTIILNVPGIPPIELPADGDTLQECYEEADGHYYFPDKKKTLIMMNKSSVAGLVRQDLAQVLVPEKNVRFPGRA